MAVQMTARHLGVELEQKQLTLVGSLDQLKPDYLKINPQRYVPALVDGSLTLCDSHAIMIYLATKYGGSNGGGLYPESLETRAKIQQHLFFDASFLFCRLRFLGVSKRLL